MMRRMMKRARKALGLGRKRFGSFGSGRANGLMGMMGPYPSLS